MASSFLTHILPHSLQDIHAYNTSRHETCWKGKSYFEHHMTCHSLFETALYIYVPMVLISFVVCHIIEYITRVISYRTSVWKQLEYTDSIRWHNKVVSYLHAWLSTILVVYALLQEPHTWRDACHAYAPRYELILAVSVGYFIFDLLFFLRHKKAFGDNTSMVVHHLVCIIAITYCVLYRIGLFYNMCLLFTEVTTIFFHQQWFLGVAGYKNGKLYQANGLVFWLLFFFCRVVWCFLQNVHLYIFSYQFKDAPYLFRAPIITPSILFLLNAYWFIMITKRVLEHGGKSPNVSKSKDSGAVAGATSASKKNKSD